MHFVQPDNESVEVGCLVVLFVFWCYFDPIIPLEVVKVQLYLFKRGRGIFVRVLKYAEHCPRAILTAKKRLL